MAAPSEPGTSRPIQVNDETNDTELDDGNKTELDDGNKRAPKSKNGEWIPRTKFRKEQKRIRRQKLNVIFNYSKIVLTEDMEKVLNRGLKFCIQPHKLDLTQLLVDFKSFERNMVWQEFWYGRKQEGEYNPPIFKTKKDNLPKNHKTPKQLKCFLGAVRSEIMDPQNRNKVPINLPPEELKALKELIELLKEKQIIIKPCDKGAGIIILDFDKYMEACNKHLTSLQGNEEGEDKPFYIKVDETKLNEAKAKLTNIIQEAFDNRIISKEELNAMDPKDRVPGRFYCTFKVHKDHKEGEAPPERPIISGSNSITENASLFVEHHIKELGNKHESFLKDTPHFLREIEMINEEQKLPKNAILVTMDVSALYTNIPQSEGVECVEEELNKRTNPKVPTGFLTRVLEFILKYNIFEFNQELYQQVIGTAMGTRPAPPYANIFMANKIDDKIKEAASKMKDSEEDSIKLLKRFLDDLFIIYFGSTKRLHNLLKEINKIHPNIKLTMSHTSIISEPNISKCECEERDSIPFLDVSCKIVDGKIVTDLFRKKCDRNQYLLTSSCHPVQCTENIPFSLALRIIRICSENKNRDERLGELKQLLLDREYREGMIDAAINKARSISREKALQEMVQKESDRRPVFVATYDPRLPDLPGIQKKHWRSMVTSDQYMAEVFPEPPLIAYRRQKNIKEFLVRAKVPPRNKKLREH